jgi:NitT/TauT family transport system substrate-binding protein
MLPLLSGRIVGRNLDVPMPIRPVAAALALLLTLSAGPSGAAETLRVLCPSWPGFAPLFVAQQLGLFDADAVSVEVRIEPDGARARAAMARGEADVDLRTIGALRGGTPGESVPGVVIGTIDRSSGGLGVVADGAVSSIADLEGKTVAVEPDTPARLALQLGLQSAGLSLRDVRLKPITRAETPSALSDPAVAAVATYAPYLSQVQSASAARQAKLLISSAPDLIVGLIVARANDLQSRADAYAGFLRGIYKAVDLYKNDPTTFVRAAAPHFGVSETVFKQILDGGVRFTDYDASSDLIGAPGNPGGLAELFTMLSTLDMDNGGADSMLSTDLKLDATLLSQDAQPPQ